MFVPERTITQDSSSKAGSYSLSQTHADMFLLGEEALLVDIENQINKYVIRRLVEYNFGAKAPQCYLKIERITDERKGFLKDIFMEMIKQGTAVPAAREIADVVGVPLNDEDNDGIDDKIEEKEEKEGDNKEKLVGSNRVNSKDDKIADKKEEKEKEGNKEYSDIHLHDSKWWREPKENEDPKVLEDIEKKINSIEKEYIDTLVNDVWSKQREQVLNRLTDVLKNKEPIENLFYIKSEEEESVEMWQPLRNKMSGLVSKMMKESYLFGQKTAIEELGIEGSTILDKEGSQFIKDRSRTLIDNFFNKMKYFSELAILSANAENKTETDIANDVKKGFDTLKDRDLKAMVESEAFLFLNRGRAFIAQKYI